MAYAWFGPCPHCQTPLAYLEGAEGRKMDPQCPRCHVVVAVARPTFLMTDHSRPASAPKRPIAR